MTTKQKLSLMERVLEFQIHQSSNNQSNKQLLQQYLLLSRKYAQSLTRNHQVDFYQNQFRILFDVLCNRKKTCEWRKLCKTAINQPLEKLSCLLHDKSHRKELIQVLEMFDEVDEHYFVV